MCARRWTRERTFDLATVSAGSVRSRSFMRAANTAGSLARRSTARSGSRSTPNPSFGL
jgi:hypothetical protein